MKKALILLALLLAFTSIGLGQGSGPITVKEVDGSPVCNNCRTFVFPNGSLTVSGNKVTVASGGGSGSPGGSNTQLQYNNVGSLGGITGATTNGTVVTLTSPVFVTPALGTPASGVLTNVTGLPPTTGILGWPANASGVLTNNGAGVLSWAAAGSGITIGTTTITSGTNTRVLYNNSGVVGEYTVTGTGNAVLSASPTLTGTAVINAATVATGAGAGTGNVPGIVKVSAPATTTSGTTEETLDSYVIKANSLASGKAIRVKVWYTMASNGNSKTVKITLGGTTIATKTFTSNNLTVTYDIVIIRSGANAQECLAWYFIGNASTWTDEVLTRTAATETDTSDITLAVKATTPTAAGDLTLRGFIVEFLN